jgi:hypothetical protein
MEVTKTAVLDIADLSRSLSGSIGQYLREEEEGLYLPFELEPILKTGRPYFVDQGSGLKKITNTNEIVGDVFDQHADIILTRAQAKQLMPASHPYPSVPIRLIKACANHLLDTHAAYGGVFEEQHRRDQRAPNPDQAEYSVVRQHVEKVLDECGLRTLALIDEQRMPPSQVRYLKEVADTLRSKVSKDVRRDQSSGSSNLIGVIRDFVYPQYEGEEEILTMIEDHLLDFKTTILDFLGKDKWIMHFLKVSRGSLTIEKTVDYRIYSWMVDHGYWDQNH